jgi:hypothetical protein
MLGGHNAVITGAKTPQEAYRGLRKAHSEGFKVFWGTLAVSGITAGAASWFPDYRMTLLVFAFIIAITALGKLIEMGNLDLMMHQLDYDEERERWRRAPENPAMARIRELRMPPTAKE